MSSQPPASSRLVSSRPVSSRLVQMSLLPSSPGIAVRQTAGIRLGPSANTRLTAEKESFAASRAARNETAGTTAAERRPPPAVAWEILRTSPSKAEGPTSTSKPAAYSHKSSSVIAVATPFEIARDHQLALKRSQLMQPTPKSELQASLGRVTDIGSDLDLEVVKLESLRRPPSSLDQYSSEATSSHRVLSSPSVVDTDSEGTSARTAGFFDSRPTSTSTSQLGERHPAGIETRALGPGDRRAADDLIAENEIKELEEQAQRAIKAKNDAVIALARQRQEWEAERVSSMVGTGGNYSIHQATAESDSHGERIY